VAFWTTFGGVMAFYARKQVAAPIQHGLQLTGLGSRASEFSEVAFQANVATILMVRKFLMPSQASSPDAAERPQGASRSTQHCNAPLKQAWLAYYSRKRIIHQLDAGTFARHD
jgi:hypothetical protein